MYPKDFLYTKEHEWIKVDGDKGTCGITDYAQGELGDIVFIELPDLGASFDANASMATIESVKAVSDMYSPVSGEIAEVNNAIVDNPAKVNEDPHGEGWFVKMKISNPDELKNLMSAQDYEEYIKAQK
jgi:glycine cleavage system H protein